MSVVNARIGHLLGSVAEELLLVDWMDDPPPLAMCFRDLETEPGGGASSDDGGGDDIVKR